VCAISSSLVLVRSLPGGIDSPDVVSSSNRSKQSSKISNSAADDRAGLNMKRMTSASFPGSRLICHR
jgi:hypothetical protein